MTPKDGSSRYIGWWTVVFGDILSITLVVLAVVLWRSTWWIVFLAGALALGQLRDMLDRARKTGRWKASSGALGDRWEKKQENDRVDH